MNYTDFFIYIVIVCIIGVSVVIYMKNRDSFDLKCIVSTVNGDKYCVRNREKLNEAVDLLAETVEKCKKLVDYVYEKHPKDDRAKRLKRGFDPSKISETLPTSEHTAYSENKGEKLAFCLNKKNDDNEKLIDPSILEFVSFHELAHICTAEEGHTPVFWENFKFLLVEAKAAGLHQPRDFKEKPVEYCSMKVKSNPYYDLETGNANAKKSSGKVFTG